MRFSIALSVGLLLVGITASTPTARAENGSQESAEASSGHDKSAPAAQTSGQTVAQHCVQNYNTHATYFCRNDDNCAKYNTQFCGANFVRCKFTKKREDKSSWYIGVCK